MPKPFPSPEASTVEPVAVLSGGGAVTVRLAGDAGQSFTLRMEEASALLLAALLAAAGPAARGAATGAAA